MLSAESRVPFARRHTFEQPVPKLPASSCALDKSTIEGTSEVHAHTGREIEDELRRALADGPAPTEFAPTVVEFLGERLVVVAQSLDDLPDAAELGRGEGIDG